MNEVQSELFECLKKALVNNWQTSDFDRWLYMDAGTSFGYAFDTRVKDGFIKGRTLVYNIQCLLREKKATMDDILKLVQAYVAETETNSKPEHGYSYFS